MKYLLLLLVLAIGLYLLLGRRRTGGDAPAPPPPPKQDAAAPMVACAHCGVHLPRDDALLDAGGRSFCGEAHRIAGPR